VTTDYRQPPWDASMPAAQPPGLPPPPSSPPPSPPPSSPPGPSSPPPAAYAAAPPAVPPSPAASRVATLSAEQYALAARLQDAVASRLAFDGAGSDDEDTRRERARELIVDEYQQWLLQRTTQGLPRPDDAVEDLLFATVLADLTGGLGRLSPLLARTDVEDIFITGCRPTWLRLRTGELVQGPAIADTDAEMVRLFASAAQRVDPGQSSREWNSQNPILNMRLREGGPMGARVIAKMDVSARPQAVIRLHRYTDVTLADLAATAMIDRAILEFLQAAVLAGASILVTGTTGAGKTTFLRALIAQIGFPHVITTIEDNFELGVHLPTADGCDKVAVVNTWEVREANGDGVGGIGMEDALLSSLREAPEWVVVGEVRGGYVVRLLEAASNGSAAIMGTIHTRTAEAVVNRVVTAAKQSARGPDTESVLRTLSDLDLAVHVRRDNRWNRFVSDIHEFGHLNRDAGGDVELRTIFTRRAGDRRGVPTGAGHLSQDLRERLEDVGYDPLRSLDPTYSSWGPVQASAPAPAPVQDPVHAAGWYAGDPGSSW